MYILISFTRETHHQLAFKSAWPNVVLGREAFWQCLRACKPAETLFNHRWCYPHKALNASGGQTSRVSKTRKACEVREEESWSVVIKCCKIQEYTYFYSNDQSVIFSHFHVSRPSRSPRVSLSSPERRKNLYISRRLSLQGLWNCFESDAEFFKNIITCFEVTVRPFF